MSLGQLNDNSNQRCSTAYPSDFYSFQIKLVLSKACFQTGVRAVGFRQPFRPSASSAPSSCRTTFTCIRPSSSHVTLTGGRARLYGRPTCKGQYINDVILVEGLETNYILEIRLDKSFASKRCDVISERYLGNLC